MFAASLSPWVFTGDALACLLAGLALLVAWAWDVRLGEPAVRWHPVVWMGQALARAGDWVQQGTRPQPDGAPDGPAFVRGALAWWLGAAVVGAVAWAVQAGLWALARQYPPWGLLLAALGLGACLKPLWAWALLRSEVQAVEQALAVSLDAGRERLRYLVSRDVAALDAVAVRESAIETLAENLNDSVVAPLFWFVLLGLPGAAVFRFANTADAMWGYPGLYQGRNWAWAGKWAARADDVLGWLPARITALLLVLVARGQGWRHLAQEARRTPSPNGGWPMAAMALGLGVRLAKPGGYVLHTDGQPAAPAHTAQAVLYASKSVLALVFIALCALALIATGKGWWA